MIVKKKYAQSRSNDQGLKRKHIIVATLAVALLGAAVAPAIAAAQQASQEVSQQQVAVAVPAVISQSSSQIVSLVNASSPMMADMVATKTTDVINLELTFRSGLKAVDPEIYFRVSSITCANGTTIPWDELAYGQWNGLKGSPKVYTNNFPAECDVTGFRLTAVTPASSGLVAGSYWTTNQNADVTLK